MRARHLVRIAVAALGLVAISPTRTLGQQARAFTAGSLVIPMDNCYQRRDSNPTGYNCNATADDGVLRAYGVVYFLLKGGVPVYWAIETPAAKTSPTTVDVRVPAPSTASQVVVRKWDWATKSVVTYPGFAANTGISYLGGPFVVAAADAERARQLLASDPMLAKVKGKEMVDIHEVQVDFLANQVLPLSGNPPKLAILNINPKPYHKTSVDVMYKYALAAGFDWSCTGGAAGDCAGGLGPSCDATVIQKYLAGTLCGPTACDAASCSQCDGNWVSPAITTARFNSGPGLVYDIVCDGDFQSASGQYPDTWLARGGYKLLWAPHWDTNGVDPSVPAASALAKALNEQLLNIRSYVAAGNNLFAECAAIGALETGFIDGTRIQLNGLPETRFQSTNGMRSTSNSTSQGRATFVTPSSPNVQVGDFAYAMVGAAISYYHPQRNSTAAVQSVYRDGVSQLISSPYTSTCTPACGAGYSCDGGTCRPNWDIATSVQYTSGTTKGGTVVYLGGHDYSPAVSGSGGQTAGTRIVLNTLFNLGFACADPVDASGKPVKCATTYPSNSACGTGTLKCGGSGDLVCVPDVLPGQQTEVCDGIDNDCNGQVDELPQCTPVCTNGATQSCYDGPAGTAGVGVCRAGTQTCTSGNWGPCNGQVTPSAEICGNGLDDDCNGTVDGYVDCPECVNDAREACYSGPAGTSGVGLCRPGVRVCTAGRWGACGGEVLPVQEVCNGLDDNCNGAADEGQTCPVDPTCVDPKDASGNPVACSTGAPSSSACATGTLKCSGTGGYACIATYTNGQLPEVCGDGIDNDCNGLVDELPECRPTPICAEGATQSCYSGPSGTAGVGACQAGTRTCTGGAWGPCLGEVVPAPEACNGRDDDCSGASDDGQVCPTGQVCDPANKVCLPTVCSNEGRRCPDGFTCEYVGISGTCKPILCPTAACPAGTVCVNGSCFDACANVTCGQGATCSNGTCFGGPCAVTGCASGQVCQGGQCIADPCASTSCAAGTFCRDGDCVRSCDGVTCAPNETCGVDGFCSITSCGIASPGTSCQGGVCVTDPCTGVACAAQQACRDGICEPDPCLGVVCGAGEACNLGQCVVTSSDPCAGVSCATGQVCKDGACVDACLGVTCSGGQVCRNGACVNPCDGVTCPSGQTCSAGQCVSTGGDNGDSGGGCGSAGGSDLLGLGLLAASLAPRLLRRRRSAGASAPWAALLAAGMALGLAACGASTSSPRAPRASSPSSAAVVPADAAACGDLQDDPLNCGATGRVCPSGQVCRGGGCSVETGNPFVIGITPSSVAVGGSVSVQLTGSGFRAGAVARFSGGSLTAPREVALSVASATTASLAAPLDLSDAAPGTMQVRVVNPGRLVSNPVGLTLLPPPGLTAVSPDEVRQDQAGVTLTLDGQNLTSDARVSIAPVSGGTPSALPTTLVSASRLTAVIDAGTLAVGTWNLTVALPGGNPSAPIRLVVAEGRPLLEAVTPLCVVADGVTVWTFQTAGASGFLYPTSAVHVSQGGDTVIPTSCATGTNAATGQCNGALAARMIVPPSLGNTTLDVWVVNPGSTPQASARRQVVVKPSYGTCP